MSYFIELRVAFATVILTVTAIASVIAEDIVVDNADLSKVTLTGSWTIAVTPSGHHGGDYIHDGDSGKGQKSVRFQPVVATTGDYKLYLRWIADPTHAGVVPVDVTHAEGVTQFGINQQELGDEWIFLGTYRFDAGTSGDVLISNTGTSGIVVADAIRLLSVDEIGPGDLEVDGHAFVHGDVHAFANIDVGTTGETPSSAGAFFEYRETGQKYSFATNLTRANATFLWQDEAGDTIAPKMELDADNALTIFDSEGNASIVLDPNSATQSLLLAGGLYLPESITIGGEFSSERASGWLLRAGVGGNLQRPTGFGVADYNTIPHGGSYYPFIQSRSNNKGSRKWFFGRHGIHFRDGSDVAFENSTSGLNSNLALSVSNSGEIGIGTPYISAQLSVETASHDEVGFHVKNTAGSPSVAVAIVERLRNIKSQNQSRNNAALIIKEGGGYPLWITDATENLNFLTIDPSGDMGIGTSNPEARLTVGDTVGGQHLFPTIAGESVIFNANLNDIDFRIKSVSNTQHVVIDAAMNHGAGGIGFGNHPSIAGVSSFLRIDPPAIEAELDQTFYMSFFRNAHSVTIPAGSVSPQVASVRINPPNIAVTSGASVEVASTLFVRDAPTEGDVNAALYVQAGDSHFGGKVGIGTDTPTATLEIDGTVRMSRQGDISMGEFGELGD